MSQPPLALATMEIIDRAAAILRNGELVAFPTETVYGLGADASNDRAVARIFSAKGRPHFNPLIVHVASIEQAARLALFDKRAGELANLFWPGPLTLVLPVQSNAALSKLATAGLSTVALRIPANDIALSLIRASGIAIAAPSANRSGRLSPTSPQHVAAEFGDEIAMVLAGGRTSIGIESTILDLSGDDAILLRPGSVTAQDIVAIIGPLADREAGQSINAPGLLAKHYAPSCPLRMNAIDTLPGEAFLAFGPGDFSARSAPAKLNLSETGDLGEAAANLFAMLHELDKLVHAGIAVAVVPETGLGIAINDRLRRASHR